MKKTIIVMGTPGAGKGTQAELISKKFGLIHFDTGKFLENLFYFSGEINDSEILKERDLFKSGKLNTPSFVLDKMKNQVKKIASSGLGIVFSGSPRTKFEAFGNDKNKGLIHYLEDLYGKENIIIFFIDIPPETSTERNSNRLICFVCGMPVLTKSCPNKKEPIKCPFCGGKLRKRILDNPKTMQVRLEEFKNRTRPVIDNLKKSGYKINNINGIPQPNIVFESIKKILNDIFKN